MKYIFLILIELIKRYWIDFSLFVVIILLTLSIANLNYLCAKWFLISAKNIKVETLKRMIELKEYGLIK
jgi:hypothetical protein